MANEITFGYRKSATLTYWCYTPSGTLRNAGGTALPETNVGVSGYYTASYASIVALDFVIIQEGTDVVGQGQYQPDVTSTAITGDLTDLEAKIDQLILDQSRVLNVYDEVPEPKPLLQVF